jgi:hypothetical protein
MGNAAKKIDLPPAIPLLGGTHLQVENVVLKMELTRERIAGMSRDLGLLQEELLTAQGEAIQKAAGIGELAVPAVGKAQLYVYDPNRKTLVLRARPAPVEG